ARRPLTRDDSWMTAVSERGSRTDPVLASQDRMHNALTNVVGGPATVVHVIEQTLTGGEILLLSTDGVHGVLDDTWLERLATSTTDLRQMAIGLVDAAMARGSRDNCTVVVARYTPD